MKIVLVVVILLFVACGSGNEKAPNAGRCVPAFDHLFSTGPDSMRSPQARGSLLLMIGIKCPDLTDDTLACLTKAKSESELEACDTSPKPLTEKGSGDSAALIDGACACTDKTCLLEYGAKHRVALRTVPVKGDPNGRSVYQLLSEGRENYGMQCLFKLRVAVP